MKTITVPAREQVSDESQLLFDQIQKKMGKVPNLYATIGYSAHALKAMLEFDATLSNQSAFTAKEREAINLVVSQVNLCNYCLAAHTTLAQLRGFTKDETLTIRKGHASDAKLDAVIQLAQSIAENKGKAEAAVLEQFFAIGYNEAALIELIGLITLRTFTNYVYSNTDIPIDFPIADELN
ncbi:carboxymuconolactone decarboxylase family protein [Mucilaginibacter terrenus]|uniref:Carboxymuconolactone decarboxylase family protein n=1 Tax=Mucilaginibacter terrenus TaxID=2482727 RepID=A0A3E2NMR6_9SPHI|nr:carboxymuconolactone decarboxylase family protein [Mucilaginibacter terrenus]RFZ82190.1 carboxymuconolactone decarboxylase family protein [Mucilaginibacter terrenus]